MARECDLIDRDSGREEEIRANLKKHEGRRLLTMKFTEQLNEHLAKTSAERKRMSDSIKRMIIGGVSNA